ncbi:hypothetical protein D920_01805, partial [Enterococcus faecalis 13-SD-W-01]
MILIGFERQVEKIEKTSKNLLTNNNETVMINELLKALRET